MQKLLLVLALCGAATQIIACKDAIARNDQSEETNQCQSSYEVTDFYPGLLRYEGVDLLFVVDNTASMTEEQEILQTAVVSLLTTLMTPTAHWNFPPVSDVRIAFTTTDMGVSYGGTPYSGEFPSYSGCTEGEGMGDNGAFQDGYSSTEVNILENTIPCDGAGTQCPPHWTCEIAADENTGRCVDPVGDGTGISCPKLPASPTASYVGNDFSPETMPLAAACLAKVGTGGCQLEQQLAAGAAGLRYDSSFVRARSLTAVIIVSDQEDCSVEDEDWYQLEELVFFTPKFNIACGKHPDLLTSVNKIKNQYERIKEEIAGNSTGLLFAAIVGVPPVASCQGRGSQLGNCLDEPLETGTMGNPAIVERPTRNFDMATFYEAACDRAGLILDTESNGLIDGYITQAYPGGRFVQLAELFEDKGYVYSICNENWTPAMKDIAELVAENLGDTCFAQKLPTSPTTGITNCQLVFEYNSIKSESSQAPPCPALGKDHQWEREGTVSTETKTVDGSNTEYWIRECVVPRISVPLQCSDISASTITDTKESGFVWYYCDNSGDNDSSACENDQEKDSDCARCTDPGGNCSSDCPMKVFLSNAAITQARSANRTSIVCYENISNDASPCME